MTKYTYYQYVGPIPSSLVLFYRQRKDYVGLQTANSIEGPWREAMMSGRDIERFPEAFRKLVMSEFYRSPLVHGAVYRLKDGLLYVSFRPRPLFSAYWMRSRFPFENLVPISRWSALCALLFK